MLLNNDVFEIIYNEAANNNIDIVKFKSIYSFEIDNFMKLNVDNKIFTNHKLGLTLYQPDLSYFPLIKSEYYFQDVFLWSKCIKTDIYKLAVNTYGEQNYSKYVIVWEDGIINNIINQFANSFKFIAKYGIFNIINEPSILNNRFEICFLDAAFNFSPNTFKGKECILYIVSKKLHRYQFKENLNAPKIESYFNSTLKKIMECPFVTEKEKELMKDRYLSILNKNITY